MGYVIKIGELQISVCTTSKDTVECDVDVVPVRLDHAPAFGEPTDFTNSRWPSYTAWNKFVRDMGLTDLFWNKEHGLMRSPGNCGSELLTNEHREEISRFYDSYRSLRPKVEPGFGIGQDSNLARLEWLRFWVAWALDNCEHPLFLYG